MKYVILMMATFVVLSFSSGCQLFWEESHNTVDGDSSETDGENCSGEARCCLENAIYKCCSSTSPVFIKECGSQDVCKNGACVPATADGDLEKDTALEQELELGDPEKEITAEQEMELELELEP